METLGGHKQNFACTRNQGKRPVTPQETEPDLPVSEGLLQKRMLAVAHHGDRALETAVLGDASQCKDSEVCISSQLCPTLCDPVEL